MESDENLLRSAQSGNTAAFDALVNKYRSRVLKLAMRFMRNYADAEDVVQETFLKAYSALKCFRGECAFYSWLHRIAINAAKTAIQIRNRDSGPLFAETPNHTFSDGTRRQIQEFETPEHILLTDEICSVVNAAIASLCGEQRRAIILRELDGLNYLEIAAALSCPVGTVRSRVFRAREAIDRQLRWLLDDEWGPRRPRRGTRLPQLPGVGFAA